MQDTVEVIINPYGKTCTTVNQHPYPSLELFYKSPLLYDQKHKKWHKSESARKTYEIDYANSEQPAIMGSHGRGTGWYFIPGTTHKAQIINNKAVIL